jgi:hypothetical protein
MGVMGRWVKHHDRQLPPPLPTDFGEAADWWVNHMQEARKDTEGADDLYAGRVVQALRQYLALGDNERQTVARGVQAGVPYRGDAFERYGTFWAETERMREMGVAEYRRQAAKSVAKILRGARQ